MIPIGDIAKSYVLRNQSAFLKTQISQLSQELSSGRSADLLAKTKGNTGAVHVLQHDLRQLAAYQTTIRESKLRLETKQTTYDAIGQSLSPVINAGLTGVGVVPNDTGIKTAARQSINQIVSSLRSSVAGQRAFEWTTELSSGDDLLGDLRSAIADNPNAQTGDTIRLTLTGILTPSIPDDAGVAIAQNRLVSIKETTPPAELVSILATLAETALADAPLPKQNGRDIAAALMNGRDGLVQAQANLGQKQELLEITEAQNAAQQTALKLYENELTSVDPYEVATKLHDASLRLEALYATTARLSQLSLTRFL